MGDKLSAHRQSIVMYLSENVIRKNGKLFDATPGSTFSTI
jgi:hypothetical protein